MPSGKNGSVNKSQNDIKLYIITGAHEKKKKKNAELRFAFSWAPDIIIVYK